MGEWRYQILHVRWRAEEDPHTSDSVAHLIACETRSGDMRFATVDLDWDEGHSLGVAQHLVRLHNAQVECYWCDTPGCDPKTCEKREEEDA